MKPQQITKLTQLEEELTDLFSFECRPKEWKEARGPIATEKALKEKKVALATMQLVGRIQNVLRDIRRTDGGGDSPNPTGRADTDEQDGDSIAREAAAFDKQAKALLKKHDRKTH